VLNQIYGSYRWGTTCDDDKQVTRGRSGGERTADQHRSPGCQRRARAPLPLTHVQPLPGAGYPPLGAPPIDWTQWHVIGGTWNASAITFYVDDVPYETKTADEVRASHVYTPLHPVCTLARPPSLWQVILPTAPQVRKGAAGCVREEPPITMSQPPHPTPPHPTHAPHTPTHPRAVHHLRHGHRTPHTPHPRAQYTIFDTAIAWYFPPPETGGAYPTTHEVDWVRVWQYAA
jgi:hypothetical protein